MKVLATGLVLAASAVVCCAVLADEISTTGGAQAGVIKEITGGDGGVVKLGDAEIPLTQVVKVDFGNKVEISKTGSLVVMTNGDRIVGKITDGDNDGVVVSTRTLGKRKVSIDNLLALFNLAFKPDSSFVEGKVELDNAADVVFLTGDQQTEGTIQKITAQEVMIDVEGLGEISLALDKIRAVKLAPLSKPKAVQGLRATVHLTDGSRLSGSFTSLKDNRLSLKWFGLDVVIARNDVRAVYFSGGNFLYLSDQRPSDVKETPFFDNFLYHYQLDHSLVNKRTISLRDAKFFKGISVHSKTELTYDLGGEYAAFACTIGVDDEAKGKGDVVFVVHGDGKELFRSRNITGESDPVSVRLPVEGVKELKLTVDFGKDLDTMDRAAWADAVLVRK